MANLIDHFFLTATQCFVRYVYLWFGINKYMIARILWWVGLIIVLTLTWRFIVQFSPLSKNLESQWLVFAVVFSVIWFVLFLIEKSWTSTLQRGDDEVAETLTYEQELVLSVCRNARFIWFVIGLFSFLGICALTLSGIVFVLSIGLLMGSFTVFWCSLIFYIFSCTKQPPRKSELKKFLEASVVFLSSRKKQTSLSV